VAQQYLIILADLGVKVGLAKSLCSKQMSLEFAKRFIWRGVDCSPLSFKELAAAKASFSSMVAFVAKFRISFATMLSITGKGYRALGGLEKPFMKQSSRIRKALVTLFAPRHRYFVSIPSFLEMISLKRTRPLKHWDLIGWGLAQKWIQSYSAKFERIEKSLSLFDGVTGETGLGLTDMEFFDIETLVKLSHAKKALQRDSRAISMMAMVLYFESFRILRKRVQDLKDE
jgi:hypothetical protein